ncbi:MAG: hypothetical protein ACREU9_11400 [Gammaproteobacteria bacterium]
MRDAECLDGMFDSGPLSDCMTKRALSLLGPEKVVQFLVKPKFNDNHKRNLPLSLRDDKVDSAAATAIRAVLDGSCQGLPLSA